MAEPFATNGNGTGDQNIELINETDGGRNNISQNNTGGGTMTPLSGMIRKKRLRFNNAWDIILLKLVVFGEAHLARHGECQNRFQIVLERFISQFSNEVWSATIKPTWKSLNDRYKKVVADHRIARRANEAASGIIEIRGEREELLDDIVLAVDEMEEGRRAEREERNTMDRRLQQAGEEIRNMAVGGLVETDESEIITPPSSTNSVAGSASRRRPFDSEIEDRQLLDEHIKRMSDYESKRLKIEEEMMQFRRESERKMSERLARDQECNERRLRLEEKRFELLERRDVRDSDDRKTSHLERKEMTTLLAALAKELSRKSSRDL